MTARRRHSPHVMHAARLAPYNALPLFRAGATLGVCSLKVGGSERGRGLGAESCQAGRESENVLASPARVH